MQLEYIKIQDFKGLTGKRVFEHDFTDELGRIHKVTLIVGPSGSGKTTILDAIWFGLQIEIGYRDLRKSFRTEPEYVVASGRNYARVEYKIRVSDEELTRINRWKNQLVEMEAISHYPDAENTTGHIIWTYPAQPKSKEFKGHGYQSVTGFDWEILKAEEYARKLHRLTAQKVPDKHLAGSVYFFEQERQIVAEPVFTLPQNGIEDSNDGISPFDIRERLVDLGVRAQLGKFPKDQAWYYKVQEGFNYVCHPKKMGDVVATNSDSEYLIEFEDNNGPIYTFNGLSSGERSVLNFLVQYYAKQMYNSIVLIDELEQNMHPIWQRRLLKYLTNNDDGNQFIITTHSPTLASYVREEQIIDLGTLEEPDGKIPAWQYGDE